MAGCKQTIEGLGPVEQVGDGRGVVSRARPPSSTSPPSRLVLLLNAHTDDLSFLTSTPSHALLRPPVRTSNPSSPLTALRNSPGLLRVQAESVPVQDSPLHPPTSGSSILVSRSSPLMSEEELGALVTETLLVRPMQKRRDVVEQSGP